MKVKLTIILGVFLCFIAGAQVHMGDLTSSGQVAGGTGATTGIQHDGSLNVDGTTLLQGLVSFTSGAVGTGAIWYDTDGLGDGAWILPSSLSITNVKNTLTNDPRAISLTNPLNTISGNGNGLTNLNATNLTGTVPNAVLPGSICGGLVNFNPGTGHTYFGAINGSYTGASTTADAKSICPRSGTVGNLYCHTSLTPASTTNLAFSILKNGSASGITCNITGNGSTVDTHDTTNTVSVVAGDTLTMDWNTSAGTISTLRFSWSFTIQ